MRNRLQFSIYSLFENHEGEITHWYSWGVLFGEIQFVSLCMSKRGAIYCILWGTMANFITWKMANFIIWTWNRLKTTLYWSWSELFGVQSAMNQNTICGRSSLYGLPLFCIRTYSVKPQPPFRRITITSFQKEVFFRTP